MSVKNPHLDYQMIGYPSPRNYKIMTAWCATQNYKKTKGVTEPIRHFINSTMNEHQQQKLLELYERMTPAQRKNPAKFWDLQDKKTAP